MSFNADKGAFLNHFLGIPGAPLYENQNEEYAKVKKAALSSNPENYGVVNLYIKFVTSSGKELAGKFQESKRGLEEFIKDVNISCEPHTTKIEDLEGKTVKISYSNKRGSNQVIAMHVNKYLY
ncbi:MAG: hypothetical protein ACP5N2_05760 [Candidatus Nanoarchaeia archaeon]